MHATHVPVHGQEASAQLSPISRCLCLSVCRALCLQCSVSNGMEGNGMEQKYEQKEGESTSALASWAAPPPHQGLASFLHSGPGRMAPQGQGCSLGCPQSSSAGCSQQVRREASHPRTAQHCIRVPQHEAVSTGPGPDHIKCATTPSQHCPAQQNPGHAQVLNQTAGLKHSLRAPSGTTLRAPHVPRRRGMARLRRLFPL